MHALAAKLAARLTSWSARQLAEKKRDLERDLRAQGFSRSQAKREAAARFRSRT